MDSYEAGVYGLVEFIIDYNNGLKGACQGGYMKIVDKVLDLGANDYIGGSYGTC